jgi:ribonuclease-3
MTAMDDATLTSAEDLLEYDFADRSILNRALTHASTAASRHDSNERLEFLGDAVLGLVVCEYLHCNHPELLEGDMTKVKSSVVSRQTCAEEAKRMGLDQLLVLGKGMATARECRPQSQQLCGSRSLVRSMLTAGLKSQRTLS